MAKATRSYRTRCTDCERNISAAVLYCPWCGYDRRDGHQETPTLDDALTGLLTASSYCETRDLDTLSERATDLYQAVGAAAPDADRGDADA